ncbi:1-aminocyclopropane-1-carboxylate deaminase/D-cysteine desulfhydrase-like pyridoxal-dependent ACC family enzyme [Mesorhizobium abyssinicae]
MGYVGFAEEVTRQETELCFAFDYIIVCVVTGSTQAGMIVGFAAQGRADRVIGIDASGTPAQTRAQVAASSTTPPLSSGWAAPCARTKSLSIPTTPIPPMAFPRTPTNDAIGLAARTEALIIHPVYEGKSGLIDLNRRGFFPEGSRILYAHLGGAPAINGYSYYYKEG